jgi:hypothetical protein
MKKTYLIIPFFILFFGKAQVAIYKNSYQISLPKITLALGDDDTGIQWNSANNISIMTNNTPKITVNSVAQVGINKNIPAYILDVDAKDAIGNDDVIKFQNLKAQPATTFTQFVVQDRTTNEVGGKVNPSSLGQFIRLPFVDTTYNAGSTSDLNLTTVNDIAPNGADNVINSIVGSSVDDGNNTVTLEQGVYSINLKVVGIFKGLNDNNMVSVHFLINNLSSINNFE